MGETEIKQMLDQLANLQAQMVLMRGEKQTLLDSVIPDDIRDKITEIEAEYLPKAEAMGKQISQLSESIKTKTAEHGSTVKGRWLQSVWGKGHVTWDDKALTGYMVDHPELEKFRKQGAPSISIREAK